MSGSEPTTSAPSDSPPVSGNGIAGGWFGRWRKDPGAATPGLAAVVLGFTVGALTGVSGPDATVLAAVLPVVLSAAGPAAVLVASKGDGGKRRTRAVSGLIVLFAVGLLVGVPSGAWYDEFTDTVKFNEAQDRAREAFNEAQERAQEARETARDRHPQDLRECTVLEYKVNAQRSEIKLPPLTISQVCPFLDDPHTGSAPRLE